eukprot:GABV01008559.1.p1 GENE.GABV01008559.1~~GABV01008559.1.p1  ORF type:complete len:133 (-),score=36.09 GABV01008559.1:426-824(-)
MKRWMFPDYGGSNNEAQLHWLMFNLFLSMRSSLPIPTPTMRARLQAQHQEAPVGPIDVDGDNKEPYQLVRLEAETVRPDNGVKLYKAVEIWDGVEYVNWLDEAGLEDRAGRENAQKALQVRFWDLFIVFFSW